MEINSLLTVLEVFYILDIKPVFYYEDLIQGLVIIRKSSSFLGVISKRIMKISKGRTSCTSLCEMYYSLENFESRSSSILLKINTFFSKCVAPFFRNA